MTIECLNMIRPTFKLCHVMTTQTEQQNIRRSGRWSGGFSPLPAPFPLRGPPLTLRSAPPLFSETRSPLRSAQPGFWPAPLRFPLRSRSAHML